MTKDFEYQEYLIDYWFQGSKYTFSIYAKNWSEAEQRLIAIKSNAWVEGCLAMRIDLEKERLISKWIKRIKTLFS